MKLNTAWLLRYIDSPIPHRDLVDAMPRAGLEVEVESELRVDLTPVKIGFVRSIEPIVDAPGMFATTIEVERGRTISVLVGSDHEVKAGWGVPVASAGVTLPTGKKVTAGKFHGVDSTGMICLDGEMGMITRDDLPVASGLYHTTDEAQLGRSIVEVMPIEDYLIELKVLPNRPDCLGVIGIAREIAALFGTKIKWPALGLPAIGNGRPVSVDIREPNLCTRFTAGAFEGVKVDRSPPWLVSALMTAGMRPINNIVDLTNFVMWETGQPLHAFDYDKIDGGAIIVRRLEGDEAIRLLNGRVIAAPAARPLVVADVERPLGLAGIMGGADAETSTATARVLIEVARFDAVAIRQTVKTLRRLDGMNGWSGGSDASYRFERGTDPGAMLEWARDRAYSLVSELAGGRLMAPATDVGSLRPPRRRFAMSTERVSRLLGMPVDEGTIRSSLTALEYSVDGDHGDHGDLGVTAPTFRMDVDDAVVPAEDVARMIGYDNIPPGGSSTRSTRGQVCRADRLRTKIAEQLTATGWYETKNDPLEGPAAVAWLPPPDDSLTLANPASVEMSTLRRSLLTGLVASTQRNIFRHATSIKLFEIDRTFGRSLPTGEWSVAGVAGGSLSKGQWRDGSAVDFFTTKGIVLDLLDAVGIAADRGPAVEFRSVDRPPYKPGAAAEIRLAKKPVGVIGELDAGLLKIERAAFPLYAFELELAVLEEHFDRPTAYTPLNRQPAVVRDIAVVVPIDVPYASLANAVRQAAGQRLESLTLVDEYKGKNIDSSSRSLALRLTFRDPSRTLTADEVAEVIEHIVRRLSEEYRATLRTQ